MSADALATGAATPTTTTAATTATTAATARLDAFAPIALPELVERAALQTRVDRKYIVPLAELDAVLADLDPATRVLEIDDRRHFGYESVYFDTRELTSYVTAAHGRRRRFKIRTRSYLDSGECYLEVKTRGARSATVKERIDYRIENRALLTAEGLDYIAETLLAAGIDGVDPASLMPVLSTRYARTTLFIEASESRATIDTELVWRLRDARGEAVLARPAMTVFETKSGSRASEVDRALWANGHRPATLSKYGTGLAALRPELPSTKWTRTLRRSFGVADPFAADLREADRREADLREADRRGPDHHGPLEPRIRSTRRHTSTRTHSSDPARPSTTTAAA